ncbi:MarR family winged helix-turn-helix transcriptional regulator [Micromonospora sp. DT81.3]|uniref:MarR family winged helix-turn-helix transcriptional regulator n=1 Tax=Micromonospora sp. DT81.3 TaxID=3416523 RepID=UPI003CF98C6A
MPRRVIPPTLPPEFGVYFALLEVSGLLRQGSERQLREEGGLSFVQFQILATLGEDPTTPRSMTYLADRLVHSKSGLTYQVGRLEQAGLVSRTPSPDDDRGVNATLTADGAALLARVLPGHVAMVQQVFVDALGAADRDQLTRLLDLVARHMRPRPPRSARVAAKPA